jgi:hypothetical protein
MMVSVGALTASSTSTHDSSAADAGPLGHARAGTDGGSPDGGTGHRSRASAGGEPDQDLLDHLDVIEDLDLLQNLDLFDTEPARAGKQ